MRSGALRGLFLGALTCGVCQVASVATAIDFQWKESPKKLNQLVREGYEIKNIRSDRTPIRLFEDGKLSKPYEARVVYTTVQKQFSAFQCREIDVMDGDKLIKTLIYCLELVDVYDRK
jgi:hypothetical protein